MGGNQHVKLWCNNALLHRFNLQYPSLHVREQALDKRAPPRLLHVLTSAHCWSAAGSGQLASPGAVFQAVPNRRCILGSSYSVIHALNTARIHPCPMVQHAPLPLKEYTLSTIMLGNLDIVSSFLR